MWIISLSFLLTSKMCGICVVPLFEKISTRSAQNMRKQRNTNHKSALHYLIRVISHLVIAMRIYKIKYIQFMFHSLATAHNNNINMYIMLCWTMLQTCMRSFILKRVMTAPVPFNITWNMSNTSFEINKIKKKRFNSFLVYTYEQRVMTMYCTVEHTYVY